MDIVREDINALNAEVKIKLTEKDYKPKVDSVLQDYQKKSRLKGFRPGKVPMGMIKKMYGTSVLVDEVNKIISQSLYEYLNENKIDVLGSPLPKEEEAASIDWKNQKDFEFTYEMGLSPKIKLKLEKEKVNKHIVTEDAELTAKYVEYLRKKFGKYEDVQEAGVDDMVYGNLTELNDSNEIVEGGVFKQDVPIVANTIEDEVTKNKFIGCKVGETIVVDPNKVAGNATVLASMLDVTKEVAQQFNANLQFTVSRISRLTQAELNQDFYDLSYGKGVIKSEAEFQNKVKEDAHKMIKVECERKFGNDVVERALNKTKIPLPDEFLKKWLVKSNEKPITMDQVQEEYDNFSKNTRWQLIKNRVVVSNEMTVSEEEKISEAKNFIRNQYAQYGQLKIEEAELQDIAKKVLANEEENKNITEKLFEKKVVDYLKSVMTVKEVEVSYDEFVKLANKQDKKSESAFSKFFKSGFRRKR